MIARPDESNSTPAGEPLSPEKPETLRSRRDSIGAITTGFIRDIDSLTATLPLAMQSIGDAHEKASDRLRTFLEEHGQNLDESRGTVEIHADDVLRVRTLTRRVERTMAAHALIPRSFLVALVSQYDAFLGQLIQALLLTKPELLNASERMLTFSELVGFSSIEAARNHVVEKEVESVLRKSHSEQFDWLENKFQMKLRQDLSVWPTFVELTERRNLFVHTGGHVSAQYMQVCRTHNVDCSNVERGDVLTVSPAYFREAYEAIFEIGVKLASVLWRKLKPDDRAAADDHLIGATYNLLVEKKYSLAKRLLDFATEVLRKYASTEHRMRFVINRVQAYKWSGDAERATALLDSEDFSALSDSFQIAEAVLRDDFPKALRLVRRMGNRGPLSLGDYREWPLFRIIRGNQDFRAVILEVFGEQLNRVSVVKESPLTSGNDDMEAAMYTDDDSRSDVELLSSQDQDEDDPSTTNDPGSGTDLI